MPNRVPTVAGSAVLAWALVAAAAGLREAWGRPPDVMATLEAEFAELAPLLPPTGEVGYLERFENAGSEDAVRLHYAAQYALVPRVVPARVGPEFLIVARDMDDPSGDPRLAGYVEVGASRTGHRVFRKLVP
jgi:hypothetical protein